MRSSQLPRFLAAATLRAVAGLGSANAQSMERRDAVSVRALQSDLMIAALTCRADEASGLVPIYNRFVGQYKAPLNDSARVLRSYYRAAANGDHEAQFDSFITRVANQASIQQKARGESCDEMSRRFPLLGMKDAELVRYAPRNYGGVERLLVVGNE